MGILVVTVAALVLLALHGLLQEVAYADVVNAIQSTPAEHLGWAVLATVASYIALMGYDYSSLHYVGAKVPGRLLALTSFVAYSLGNTVGLGALTGGAVRMRLYSAAGVETTAIARAIGFNLVAFGMGLTVVGAVSLLMAAPELALPLGIPVLGLQAGALLVLSLTVAFIVLCLRTRTLVVGRLSLALPSASLAGFQLLISALDILAAGAVLWALLPASDLDPVHFLACYAVAIGAGVISHVPGGLGVFEAVMLVGVGNAVPREQLAERALVLLDRLAALRPGDQGPVHRPRQEPLRLIPGSGSIAPGPARPGASTPPIAPATRH